MVQWVSVKILVQSGCLMLKLTIPIKVWAQNHQTQTSFSLNCPLNTMLPLHHVTIKRSSCANRSDLRDGGWASEGMLADYKSIWTSHLHCWVHTQTSLHHLSAHLQSHRPRHPSGRIYIVSIKDPFRNVHICEIMLPMTCSHMLYQVMLTREDLVVLVQNPDGSLIVEHADGTRITSFLQDRTFTGSPHHPLLTGNH